MAKKTIAKFFGFVILAVSAACCDEGRRMPTFDEMNAGWDKPKVAGQISSDEITESSGLAASLCQPNVLWTHNDSGDGPFIYAMTTEGKNLGVWKVTNADNTDWEDMALTRDTAGQCHIYIAETGNTDKLDRGEHTVYRFKEPVTGTHLERQEKAATEPAERMKFKYPDGNHDAEAMFVHPTTGAIYVLTKKRSEPSGVYKVGEFRPGAVVLAARLGSISMPVIPSGFVTGGSVSPDGTRAMICDYAAAYELTLPQGITDFDEIWKQKPLAVELGSRKQGETIAYGPDGKSIFATSERKNSPVIEVKRK